MTFFFDVLNSAYLGYSAVFVCLGFGFLFLRKAASGEVGPGYWSVSFFLNSAGFLFQSGSIPLVPWQYYLIGDVLHMLGFLALVCGAYRFTGNNYTRWNFYALAGWSLVWIVSIPLFIHHRYLAGFLLKALRSLLFFWAGFMILKHIPTKSLAGRRLSGYSLIAWGVYDLVFAFFRVPALIHLAFGFLVGFQIMAALGMVVLVVDRMRIRVEQSENRAKRLEGLLPICFFCKKIKDEHDNWHVMEKYIMERSDTEFSHGFCPECAKKHYPDYYEESEHKKPT
jgi:hypothetical protein